MLRIFILTLILFLPSFAQSQEPAPSSGNAITKPVNGTNNNGKKTASNKHTPKFFPAIIEISKTPVIQIESKDKTEEKNWYSSPEWWMVSFTFLLAIITAALAIYTGKLYHATVNLGRDAKDSSTRQTTEMERSLAIAKESADATKEAAYAAKITVGTMRLNAEQELRAYVFPNIDKDMDRGPDWHQRIPLIIQNYGKTPAHDLTTSLYIVICEYPPKTPIEEIIDHTSMLHTSAKTTLAPSGYIRQYTPPLGPIDTRYIDDIMAGRRAVFVSSEVVYFDAFNNKHTTRMCLYSTGNDFSNGLLATYTEGNEAD